MLRTGMNQMDLQQEIKVKFQFFPGFCLVVVVVLILFSFLSIGLYVAITKTSTINI